MNPAASPPSSSVFLVDDDLSVRRSLQRLLEFSGYRVLAFESGAAFLDALDLPSSPASATAAGPACLITDLRMPSITGLELQAEARRRGLDLPVIFISGHGQVPDAVQAMKNGAVDFFEKPVDPQQLLRAVAASICRHQDRRVAQADRDEARAKLKLLTRRERQVCELVCQGLLNKQIAAELGTSEKTVKAQRGSATRKLGVSSAAALVDLMRKGADPLASS